MIGKIKLLFFILSLVSLSVMACRVAFALEPPTAIVIISVDNYRHVVEDDDVLVVAHYEIRYATTPTTIVTEGFLFRVWNSSDEELGRVAPIISISPDLNLDNGYGEGVVSIYFPAATAPTWESNLTYRLEGNPVEFVAGTIPLDETTNETWNSACTNRSACGTELRADLIAIANELENDWDSFTDFLPLLIHSAGGTVLSAEGQTYFQRAIPGLQQMAPTLFAHRVTSIAPTPTVTFDVSYRDTLRDRLEDTVTGTGLDRLGTAFGTTPDVARTLLAVVIFFIALVFATKMTGDIRIGLLAGVGLMVLGAGFGVPPLNALAVFALGATVIVGWVFFYQKA